jgi:hypothetical protein
MPYLTKIREYFRGRPELGAPALHREFEIPDDVAVNEFAEVIRIFGERYSVPLGVLRPTDPMRVFLSPPRSSNPVTWLHERTEFFASVEKLEDHLVQQREGRDLGPPAREPGTLREYVLSCLGFELEPAKDA